MRLEATWPGLILMTAARTILATLAGLAVWAAVPAAFGWQSTTVISGSMTPAIAVGDVVAAKPVRGAEVQPGQVALVDDPDHQGALRLHRMVRFTPGGALILRGDANRADDSSPVHPSAVHGVGALRVPWAGLPGLWLGRRDLAPLGLASLGIGLLVVVARGRMPGSGDRTGVVLCAGLAIVALTATTIASRSTASAGFAAQTLARAEFAVAELGYRDLVLADRPIAFYEGESSDPARDSVGAQPSTAYGVRTTAGGHQGASSGSLDFGGPAATLTLRAPQTPAGPTAFSTEAWFRTTASGRGGRIIGYGSTADNGASFFYDRVVYLTAEGKLLFGIGAWGTSVLTAPGRYDDGAWHHVVAARDAGGMRLIVDGQTVEGAPGATQDYAGYWRAGYDNLSGWTQAPAGNSFPGVIDDIAIYDRALSAEAARAHYAAGQP
ncbi:hypothetical protein G9U51_11865 [Calidifontibacter sp. DB0510]|uniref:Laminin G domain-containing protein n=1 Tax=Metallococcus carri TaxID=1656884 RepID=A0A967B0D9_9MICO|nr:LamG-like jellyroll fold domain-containing protein [Metallococcus carri]NHN56474.1 hypothetical protein [Metallococcus carri]NOP36098.1 hypothetical protein [Calidifontibacter sp. DB2511S]